MRVTIEFFGQAREAAGTARLVADCNPPSTPHELIVRMARERGGRLADLLLHEDELAPSILIAVNDREAADPVQLKDGDQVTVIPPVSGGSARMTDDLNSEERATYAWQMWTPGVGEEGQRRLKGASVLVTRVGGLGGLVAYELAAAGVGRLVLAHAGTVKPADLNRQLLMTHAALGSSRVECAAHRLRELNPRLDVVAIPENTTPENAQRLVAQVDLVACCAPLFTERLLLNEQCVRRNKPMIDCAMYDLTGQLTTILPGRTACLACRVPTPPVTWKREFPVFGAVAGAVGCLGAVEAIKLITGIGEPLADRLLTFDLRDMRFRTLKLSRRANCAVCGGISPVGT